MKTFILSFIFITLMIACKKEDISGDTNVLSTITTIDQFESEIKEGVSIIFYHATWCPKCAAQRPAVEALTKVTSLGKVFMGQVDYEKNANLVSKYGVLGFPTIQIYKDNQLKETLTGQNNSQAKMEEILKKLI
jgi:thioredoxin 1